MIKINKNISLSATSNIGDEVVVRMTASIDASKVNNTGIVKTIVNNELYEVNKTEVRKDMAEFETAVYETEDKM